MTVLALEAIKQGIVGHGVHAIRFPTQLLHNSVRIDCESCSDILRSGGNVPVLKRLNRNRQWFGGRHVDILTIAVAG